VQYEYEYTGGLYNFNCTGQFQLVGSILNGLESTHELFPFDSFSLFDQLTDWLTDWLTDGPTDWLI